MWLRMCVHLGQPVPVLQLAARHVYILHKADNRCLMHIQVINAHSSYEYLLFYFNLVNLLIKHNLAGHIS